MSDNAPPGYSYSFLLNNFNENHYINNDDNIDNNDEMYKYINNLNIYYLNTDKDIDRNEQIKMQFKKTNTNNNIQRIKAEEFPKLANKILKQNLLTWNHINMWKLSIKNNDDGALFFEDDIILLKNWKNILVNMFKKLEKKNIHIIRLDAFPFISIKDQKKDKVGLLRTQGIWCTGGYYVSRDFIITALNHIKCNEWSWKTIEYLINDVKEQYFNNYSFESVPRICIQPWFMENTSYIQSNNNSKKLQQVMYSGYLDRYKEFYELTDDMKEYIKKMEKVYENNKYKETVV